MEQTNAAVHAEQDTYHIVINDEEQYSIWRSDKTVPAGWRTVGEPMPKQDCLDRISALWTDMRPASLRGN
ncbi:MbtH family NRPS accessory protein [Paraburkholderia sp. A1RI_3L]|uniref:MbtH family protein n=1 Tax=Paraburkholderia TaxID=1822464 RepID=UPI003B80ACBE